MEGFGFFIFYEIRADLKMCYQIVQKEMHVKWNLGMKFSKQDF